jgi:hypothetical protein
MVLVGERLDRQTYDVIRTIGEGNAGVCYHAYHEIFGCDVVQKTVSLLGVQDALAHSEPRLLKDVKHACLVEVWEAQWEPDPRWKSLEAITFVMPYYRGAVSQMLCWTTTSFHWVRQSTSPVAFWMPFTTSMSIAEFFIETSSLGTSFWIRRGGRDSWVTWGALPQ